MNHFFFPLADSSRIQLFLVFLLLYIQDSTESAQVCERGGHGIRKDLELGLFQGSPKAQPRYMHKAIGSNILSEFEETFLLKILNAFHSRQRFSCVKTFKATVSVKCSAASGYRQNSDGHMLLYPFTTDTVSVAGSILKLFNTFSLHKCTNLL